MDEMEREGAFSSMPKINNGNTKGEMEKECEIEKINSGENGSNRFEIMSCELVDVNEEQLNLDFAGKTEEEFKRESYMAIGGEEKKDMRVEMNNDKVDDVEIEITSFETMKMNGEESILTLDGKEGEFMKEFNGIITLEHEKAHIPKELNSLENVDDEVVCKEDVKNEEQVEAHPHQQEREFDGVMALEQEKEHIPKELNTLANVDDKVVYEEVAKEEVKNEEQVEVVSKKKIVKSRKSLKKGSKKSIASRGVHDVIVNDMNHHEPLTKNLQIVEASNNKESGDNQVVHKDGNNGMRNEEQVEEISKKKQDNLRKRRKQGSKKKMALKGKKNVIAKCAFDQKPLNNNLFEELNNEENGDGGVMHEEHAKGGIKDEKQVEGIFKKKINRSRKDLEKGSNKRIDLKGVNEVIVKDMNKQEPSGKNATKKAKIAGMIFMCSAKTKNDCYQYKILGLPSHKRDDVLKINKGMKLFLFDFDLKSLYGIYEAAGPGGYNIEPKAFKSAFPSQVRFTVYEDCLPLPEEKFRKAIKDNYYQKNKFRSQLTSKQVNNLCKLFRAANKGSKSKGLHRDLEAQTHKHVPNKPHRPKKDGRSAKFTDRDSTRKRHFEAETHRSVHQDRTRKRHRRAYERDMYTSPVPPPPSHAPLPPPSTLALAPRSYDYEGTLDMNVYRRNSLVEHQGRQFRDLEFRQGLRIDQSRDSFNEHCDRRFLGSESRHREGIEYRDPYALYRDRPSYLDPLYSPAQPSEYHADRRTSLYAAFQPGIGLHDRSIGARYRY